MTLIAIVLVGVLGALSALLAPVSILEVRQGREAFARVQLEGAAEAALVQAAAGGWVAATAGAPPGTNIALPSAAPAPRVSVSLGARALIDDLWLVHGRAIATDLAGGALGARRAGWLFRVGVFPPDTVRTARLIGRPWVPGFE
jgi:hypothetical protein